MMKRIILIVIAAVIAISPVHAQSRREVKAAKKEAKLATKQLKSDGFKLLELGDLRLQLENFLIKAKTGNKQIIGTADDCISINLGKTIALNNALVEYANLSGGIVKGRITSDASNVNGQQADNLVAAYERLVLKEIKGEVQTYVTLIREEKKTFDVRVYCLVDFDSAHAAKMKAMEQALEELDLSQQYGSKTAEWVGEGWE